MSSSTEVASYDPVESEPIAVASSSMKKAVPEDYKRDSTMRIKVSLELRNVYSDVKPLLNQTPLWRLEISKKQHCFSLHEIIIKPYRRVLQTRNNKRNERRRVDFDYEI